MSPIVILNNVYGRVNNLPISRMDRMYFTGDTLFADYFCRIRKDVCWVPLGEFFDGEFVYSRHTVNVIPHVLLTWECDGGGSVANIPSTPLCPLPLHVLYAIATDGLRGLDTITVTGRLAQA